MPRPNPIAFFKQSLKSDAYYADEVINIFLLRPLAASFVWLLYPTRVTPNQVTVIAVAFGLAAALFYLFGEPGEVAVAGLLVTAKDIFDDADGQLARLRAETPAQRTNSLADGHSGVQARLRAGTPAQRTNSLADGHSGVQARLRAEAPAQRTNSLADGHSGVQPRLRAETPAQRTNSLADGHSGVQARLRAEAPAQRTNSLGGGHSGVQARLRAEAPAQRTNSLADGHSGVQARAKEMYSRRGRFLDSIGDFAVDLAVFSAITYAVWQTHPDLTALVLGFLALIGITLRVSYHVFYQASFLHLNDRYKLNRIVEDITEEDRRGDRVALRLQQIFVFIYGWQDRLMYRLDRWCSREELSDNGLSVWYSDRFALRLSGLLGFGTEFALLTLCSLFNELYLYLLLNVFLMNGIWLVSIFYRRVILTGRVNQ